MPLSYRQSWTTLCIREGGGPTLQFPRFSLFFFGNLLHVFVVYVVLAHKAIYSTVQKVYSWMREQQHRNLLEAF